MTLIPDYGQPQPPQPASPALVRFILGCWFVPLVVGVLTFLAWIPTRWAGFELFGFIWIGVGTLAAGIGGIGLIVYLIKELLAGRRAIPVLWRSGLFAALILSNFGVALLILRLVDSFAPRMD